MATINMLNVPLSGENGTGSFLGNVSPTMINPTLGTPSSGILSGGTAYALANITGLGTNVSTFLATPSSANLASALTDEVGSGSLAFENTTVTYTPTFTFSGSSVGLTYTTRVGFYSRVGNTIVFTLTITLSAKGSSVGNVFITNALPVASRASTNHIFKVASDSITFAGKYLEAQAIGSTTTMAVAIVNSGGARTSVTNTGVIDTSSIVISGSYLV